MACYSSDSARETPTAGRLFLRYSSCLALAAACSRRSPSSLPPVLPKLVFMESRNFASLEAIGNATRDDVLSNLFAACKGARLELASSVVPDDHVLLGQGYSWMSAVRQLLICGGQSAQNKREVCKLVEQRVALMGP